MTLERSVVFRQLDVAGRFARLDYEDALPPLLGYSAVFIGSLFADYHPAYAAVVLVALGVGMVLLRYRFPDGIGGLLRYLGTPKHLGALAVDRLQRPYPASTTRGAS